VGLPRLQGTVAITGTLEVGEDLTVDIAKVTPNSGDFSYIWLRGDGQYEEIATAPTYTLTAEDAGKSIQVIVKVEGTSGDLSQTRGPVPLPLTADISFNTTEDNSAQVTPDVANWTGAFSPRETWILNAGDQSPVYFTVSKTQNQSITVSGSHAAKVRQTVIGESRDGSIASAELEVFEVNTGDILFAGGTKEFTLNIAEPGKAPKAVSVTLNIRPTLTGVAVFKVLEDPTPKIAGDEILERIGGIKHFVQNESDQYFTEQDSPGENLLDALAWIDRNAEDQGDYLVRVENDEALPTTYLSCLYREVKIRLRGYDQGRKISNNGLDTYTSFYVHEGWFYNNEEQFPSYCPDLAEYFIAIGAYMSSDNGIRAPMHITLQLEDQITLQGEGDQNTYESLIYVAEGCTLIMLDGSTITGFYSGSGYPMIRLSADVYGREGNGFMYMYGGTITGNTVRSNTGLIYINTSSNFRAYHRFVKEGGSITGNTDRDGNPHNKIQINSKVIEIKEGVRYSLPVDY
jgi:hypothetical protein